MEVHILENRETLIINQMANNFAQKIAILEGEKAILQIDLQEANQKVQMLEQQLEERKEGR